MEQSRFGDAEHSPSGQRSDPVESARACAARVVVGDPARTEAVVAAAILVVGQVSYGHWIVPAIMELSSALKAAGVPSADLSFLDEEGEPRFDRR
jgi:hypothetical protein